jgi:periplasmic glucans biosynthesis protein
MRDNHPRQKLSQQCSSKARLGVVGVVMTGLGLISGLAAWVGTTNGETPRTTIIAQVSQPRAADTPASPALAMETPSIAELVRQEARELSIAPFREINEVNIDFAETYDEYRRLRFQPSRALWHREPPGIELQGLPLGWLFKRPIELFAVENGSTRPINFTGADFLDERGATSNARLKAVGVPLSGFRIGGPLNGIDKMDEIIVFQGASYFRALGRGHVYGLSARGLAIGTASSKGEEFPTFRKFWVEKPAAASSDIVIHALLDSPSASGAYSFIIRPGAETVVDVNAALYPRREIADVGLAPLTSMFLVGPVNPTRARDFRPRVHDSDGLAIFTGRGERIWRPISNPRTLEVSSFVDDNPRGFGLMQRRRTFSDYQDLEARYERRPSAWVEFVAGLGRGGVVLVELPTEEEIHDNIVAFWRPNERLEKGREHVLRYRLHWRDDTPTQYMGPWILDTRIGRAYHGSPPDSLHFIVDYLDRERFTAEEAPVANVYASAGVIRNSVSQINPETGGVRVSFIFEPRGKEPAELRLNLGDWGGRVPETWLYRWTSGQ